MKSKIAAGPVAEQSNQQLLEQANLPFVGNLTTVRAPVVSGAIANFDDTIQIGKGSRERHPQVDMPVVVGTGLVGHRRRRSRATRRSSSSSPTPRSRWG